MYRHRISVNALSPIRSPTCHLWHTRIHVRSWHNALHPAKATSLHVWSGRNVVPGEADPSPGSARAQHFTRRKKSALSRPQSAVWGVWATSGTSGEPSGASGSRPEAAWGVRRTVLGVWSPSGSRLESACSHQRSALSSERSAVWGVWGSGRRLGRPQSRLGRPEAVLEPSGEPPDVVWGFPLQEPQEPQELQKPQELQELQEAPTLQGPGRKHLYGILMNRFKNILP